MFINLVRDPQFSTEFTEHNFDGSFGVLFKVSDPAFDVELALRDPRGWLPSSDLIPTLSFTLSRACCRSFLEQHPSKPINERDYYLSKLYQFFSLALLDEGCEVVHFDAAACRLDEILASLYFAGSELPDFTRLDWLRIFSDYKTKDLEGIISDLPAYLPPRIITPTAPAPSTDELSGESVNRRVARKYLDLSRWQVRNLIKQNKLKTVGKGQDLKITTDSLRRYKGDFLLKKTGNKRKTTKANGTLD